jgi:tryptophan 2,3-dioxygenase
MYAHIYWGKGATELSTGQKTLTLKRFEEKYGKKLIQLANECQTKNLWYLFKNNLQLNKLEKQIIAKLKKFDKLVNVIWPTMHLKSAVRYLQKDPEIIAATGGTNWQKYLPPRYQKRIFYPDLWTDAEKENWGKLEAEELLSK